MIEKAEPPNNFEAPYSPLPERVEFRKIINNILNSIKFLSNKQAEPFAVKNVENLFNEEEESKFERWLKYLQLEENVAVVSDAFWFSICKFFN